ncbi:MAG: class I SAM-dependent DNA methyltransferase [Microcoleus sp. PH2017_10_PVI_O_A]|uniref:class I SAM-dependent DNA methyltransferase n=1 Tax=unclassified Microcoleus TaxID=2642155 RepID=UPI001DEDC0DD|nr:MULTISPECIES: DNA methyltransferase [unclassified Microcoleus]TAE76764.1 MAG: class I SAM-dependent DNA methyltransferase [Oscillatoriales cyanobacterium]MCC3409190.1 class I SAM-dependent DNA methyltransferase [Microcoleus sp. PH2017_10_PVI_O_A]MCC3463427.1 class I SAM-dependent DNA methyltransferase [Microcoleus sp. PH2017_11_PCY_U_A]MCC3481794.1 class I SAM-dependent DNA methyltransferase [Microcoleus sp. PH2017_12_PCY_D_A]MCC3530819.1 class I SAM-dependent DNA methyltransferase [Microco
MNAVEIEEAVSRLAEAPFDSESFPFAFLEAFGNKQTTLKKLQSKSGSSNQSDLPGGVLQRNNIHLQVCPEGEVSATLTALRESKATARYKAKFILATDGKSFEAENLADGETVACNYPDFHDHFGFFLPLAGITTVRQIRENAFDIKATGRLNRLYIELLKDNPGWDGPDRREALNHFMARLIFCFFAEDTNIFHSEGLFTATVAQMSDRDSLNTHEVLSELFRSMSTPVKARESAQIRNWANVFPYVNGGLFSGGVEVPRFSKISRSYLLHVGNLDWTKINPDIFGSMIQAVADDEERGALGMHYTSVPNILKVLNPLFLDDLRSQLDAAGDNARKLLNLRSRIARIRVFDPACGSGNFLVIAYKEMRKIEAKVNELRGEGDRKSEIPLTNFRGIEIRHFSCEIARLALIIAEYQCDVLYRGPKLALAEFLPLKADNWITCGNALRLDWLSLCPPTGTGVKVQREDLDLWGETREQAEIDFENEGGETYICGNPPYLGSTWQSKEQKDDLKLIFNARTKLWKSLDYVSGWFMKAADYGTQTISAAAFVSTNSTCQGQQVPILWPQIFKSGHEIAFAHTSFKWANLASHNAGVTVAIVGISNNAVKVRQLFSVGDSGETIVQEAENINAYLVASSNVFVESKREPIANIKKMTYGNKPVDGGYLFVSPSNIPVEDSESVFKFLRPVAGSHDYINGSFRHCLWIKDEDLEEAKSISFITDRLQKNRANRLASRDESARKLAERAHQFRDTEEAEFWSFIVPRHSSENRPFLPAGILNNSFIVNDSAFALYDAPLWNMALIASRLHLVWIATVCGKLKTDFRYSNTLGWNTFPVPTLTDRNKADLTRSAEDILLAREQYFPATIADMYDPKRMDTEFPLVREAHERNDEILDRIYIGRRFKNDTERLEKLFELYTKMTSQQAPSKKSAKGKGGK